MSILRKQNKIGHDIADVIAQTAVLISDQQGTLVTKDSANMVLGMESLDTVGLEQAHVAYQNVQNQLESIGLADLIKAQLGGEDGNGDVAMESACLSLMAAGDSGAYHQAYIQPQQGPSSDAVMVESNELGFGDTVGMESFTSANFDQFAAMSVVIGALSLAQSSFDELFFPTEIIGAGKSGQEVSLSVPYAFNRTKRADNGAAWDFEKKSLVHAIEDHTILESHATDIYPHAGAGANNDAFLVDAAVIANQTMVLGGVDIVTRPLIFGKEVDLLAVSAHPGLIGDDGQDETDALEPNVSIGTIYVRITDTLPATPVAGVYKMDISGTPGTLFTRPAESGSNDLTVNFNGTVSINSEMTNIAGVSIDALDLHTKLGVTLADDWNVDLDTTITGFVNTERANMKMFASGFDLGSAFTGADKTEVAKSSAEYTSLTTDVTIELIAYMPKARRINANLRMKGIFIDNAETNRYYFPIEIGAPVSSVKPVSSNGGGATVEGLIRGLRTRSSNSAVTTLLKSEVRIDQMMRSGSAQTNASTIGSLLVKPMYAAETLDVQAEITIHSTSGGVDDLRALIIDKISIMADKLALESSYLSALENFIGNDKDYVVIIGTDPRIAGLIMRSGDERTLGFKHNFEIQSSLDLRMRDKIYISFRRKSQKGIDPLSFGSHLSMPALVHEVANSSRGGATVSEVQVMPKEAFYNSLPILGKIDIANLENYYHQ